MIKKAAIYDPYLDTLGGGERYCLTVAEFLLKSGWNVDLFWSGDSSIISRAQDRFNLQISGLKIVPDIFGTSFQMLKKIQTTRFYDLAFFLSDGSLPFLFAKQNVIHFQVPFRLNLSLYAKILNGIKLLNTKVVCNSQFTQQSINSTYNVKSQLLYPPVDISQLTSTTKQKIILSVGRFDNILNAKRQDVLISAFIKLCQRYSISDWKLILAGGSLASSPSNHYLTLLKKQAQGHHIEFLVQPSFEKLAQVYASSSIYWHAAGFGVDEITHPENTEHFGMTVVEAMAVGLVPLVVNKGGLPEIVKPLINGYLWQTEDQLIEQTYGLIKDRDLFSRLSLQSIADSQKYSKQNFEDSLTKLLHL